MRKHTLFCCILAFLALSPRPLLAAGETDGGVPAAVFFPVLAPDAPPEAAPELIPVASNYPLSGDHTGIKRAIIIIHDFSRDATRMLAEITTLGGASNSGTLILAPQFLLESDIARFAEHLPEGGGSFARWPLGGWSTGGDSLPLGQQKGLSSFSVLDLLLLYLADKATFPDMQQIVIAGHGEGGDFVQRYAAAGQAPDVLDRQGLPVRFVVSDASAYVYFTAARPEDNAPPKDKTGNASAPSCADFDNWPYGLEAPNPYVQHVGANAIKLRYVTRAVVYLAGSAVTPADPAPDTSCAAGMQGATRAARAGNYQTYLHAAFGDAAGKLQSFSIQPNAGYDQAALFGSACGVTALFGDGNCAGGALSLQTGNP